ALHIEGFLGQVAEAFTQSPARRSRQTRSGLELDVGQAGTGQDQENQADQAPGEQPAAPLPGLVTVAEYLPGLNPEQQREHVGEIAQGHEQDIGEPGAGAPGGVLHLLAAAGVGPARVVLVVGQQRHPQDQAERAERDQRSLLEAVMQLLTPGRGLGCGTGVLQNAVIPARGVWTDDRWNTLKRRPLYKFTGVMPGRGLFAGQSCFGVAYPA